MIHPHAASAEPTAFVREMLPHVSRTFALTIPVLREPLRTRVGIAYLLCRMVDTAEDRGDIPASTRETLFAILGGLARRPRDAALRTELQAAWPDHPDPQHDRLLRRADLVLDALAGMDGRAARDIAECLEEMIEGMAAFPCPHAGRPPVAACPDLDALERYCHAAAGTVGILLSRLFAPEIGGAHWLTPVRAEEGRRFGLGLQLVNVLKDRRGDVDRGIRYVPAAWMEGTGSGERLSRAGRVQLVELALEHLDAAQSYILSLPAAREDMRLFCLWAAHLGLATLRRIAAEAPGGAPPKVDRDELARVLDRARGAAGDDTALDALHREYRGAVTAALAGTA